MRRARAAQATLLMAGVGVALAACSSTTVVGASRTFEVGVSEYRVAPQEVSVPAGPVTLIVHNFGRLAHNLAITRGGRVEAETTPIQPGSSVALAVDLTAGSYVIASTLFDDQALGAYGTLLVRR
jgi:hypothetical protein